MAFYFEAFERREPTDPVPYNPRQDTELPARPVSVDISPVTRDGRSFLR